MEAQSIERIALISDIHGNLPALEAVLADIRARGADQIIVLGDLAGKGPQPVEAIDRIRALDTVVIRGNWDDFLAKGHADHPAAQWQQEQLRPEQRSYLASLPFSYDFWLSGRLVRLFHASAESVYKRIYPISELEERRAMFHTTPALTAPEPGTPDLVGYGDIHYAYLMYLDKERTLFNAGSVGNPLDLPQPVYVMLEGKLDARTPGGPLGIQFIRVPYDLEESIRIAARVGLPDYDAWVQETRTARYRGAK